MNTKSDYRKEAENFLLMTVLSIALISITFNLMMRGINGDRMAYRWLILLMVSFVYVLRITKVWEFVAVKLVRTPLPIALLSLVIIPSRYLVTMWGLVSAISVIILTAIIWMKYSFEYFEYLDNERNKILNTLRTSREE